MKELGVLKIKRQSSRKYEVQI